MTTPDPRVQAALARLGPTPSTTGAAAPRGRLPVHTVYGGAHLFKAGTARRFGDLALAALDRHAPGEGGFASGLGLAGDAPQHARIDARVREKLAREPVEDYRIDFEDGFGWRSDEDEDAQAVRAAGELARAWSEGTAPPLVGIRVKALAKASKARSARTLRLFLHELGDRAGGVRPGFLVTWPKVGSVAQVEVAVELLGLFEVTAGLAPGTLRLELMVESASVLVDADGRCPLPALIRAADGRCEALHLGAYDLTASIGVTGSDQTLDHPLCDLARQLLVLACADTATRPVDGATNVLPLGEPDVVWAAWRLHAGHVRRAMRQGLFQGWDLHPAQLPARYAATYGHFAEAAPAIAARLRNFVDQSAQATRVGAVFDDWATGRGLVGFFSRALSCGALDETDLATWNVRESDLRAGVGGG